MKRKSILFLCFSITLLTCLILSGTSQDRFEGQDRNEKLLDAEEPHKISIQGGVYDPVPRLSQQGTVAFWPSIAVNHRDEIMVVFTQAFSGEANDIYYTMSSDGGDTWTTPIATNSLKELIKSCDVVADDDGNFHLVYSDGASSGSREIYYRAYINGSWRPKERISQSTDNANWCRIDTDGDNVHIAWYQELAKAVIYLKSKKIGEAWPATPEDVFNEPNNGYIYPALSAEEGNIYVIAQRQNYSGGDVATKQVVFREKRDGQWLGIFTVGAHAWPAIKVDSRKNVHCLYPNYGKVHYRARIGETNWNSPANINTLGGVDGFFDMDYRNDTLIAVYLMDASRNPEHWSVWFRVKKFDKNWGPWGESVETDMGGYADWARVAIDSEGFAHMVWADWHTQAIREPDTVWYNKWEVAKPDVPTLDLNNYSFSFEVQQGEPTDSQNLTVRNSGPGTLNYQISTNQDWLTVTPTSGTCENDWIDHWIDIDTNIEEGVHNGVITVNSGQADNSPVTADVTVNILPPPIFEPLDFTVEKKENRSGFFRELIHLLKWEPNPQNRDIVKYQVTCEYEDNGEQITRVFDVTGGDTTEYANRMVVDNTEYTYSIRAVDDRDRMGPAAVFTINN
jgi:hypothetical protein